jgi:Cu+-exporting ATPase
MKETSMSNTSHQFNLQLSGLSCGKCIKKLNDAVSQLDNNVIVTINDDKSVGTFKTQLSKVVVRDTINSIGFSAQEVGQPHQHVLDVSGVSCQGCVSKIRKAIQECDNKASVDVDINTQKLQVSSTLTLKKVKQLVDEKGYLLKKVQPRLAQTVTDQKSVQTDAQVKTKNNAETHQLLTFQLQGVTCASCVNTIQTALDSHENIAAADINFANRSASIQTTLSAPTVIDIVKNSGYNATLITNQDEAENKRIAAEKKEYQQKIKHTSLGLGLGIPMMLYGMLGGSMSVTTSSEQLVWGALGIATLAVLWWAGKHYFTGAWRAFKNRNANMDTLVAMGTGTAWLYSMVVVIAPQLFPINASHLYFEASAMIIGLINLGQALELKARGRTSQAIRRLLDLRSKTAVVIRDGIKLTVPIEQVTQGEIIYIRAGERIPVDGTIQQGEATIDESMLTGEPIPVFKKSDDKVSSGTINGDNPITIYATKIGSETVLGQIIQMVSKAQNSKPPISHLADKVSSIFVPTVMIIAVITALAWYNFGPQPAVVNMLITATSVLIIACPCALGLATPISTMIGVGKAAESGGLIRNGDALQKASSINIVVLDKTGTITQGNPSVVNTQFWNENGQVTLGDASNSPLLSLIKSVEEGSTHPLAKAVINYCEEVTAAPLVENIESLTGLGIQATYNGQQVLVGSHKLMTKYSIDTERGDSFSSKWESQANTVIYVSIAGEIRALFGISDPIKQESKQAISLLKDQGINVVMLTGDNRNTAQSVASEVGIEEFYAELLPQEKLQWVTHFQKQGHVVAMVGDGINDAPALAQSDVGFAIGQGTDVAIESADITLIRSSLTGVSHVIDISKATIKNIKQNLWGAFIYNTVGIPIAAGILFPLTGLLLSPIIAGAAMSLSSITVVSNANRLRLFEPQQKEKAVDY